MMQCDYKYEIHNKHNKHTVDSKHFFVYVSTIVLSSPGMIARLTHDDRAIDCAMVET